MNIAEASRMRELLARVDSLERQVADLTRRLDDVSKAERAKDDSTLRLKKSG
jgi:uncharacterized protein YceH (UPF0502 family)